MDYTFAAGLFTGFGHGSTSLTTKSSICTHLYLCILIYIYIYIWKCLNKIYSNIISVSITRSNADVCIGSITHRDTYSLTRTRNRTTGSATDAAGDGSTVSIS